MLSVVCLPLDDRPCNLRFPEWLAQIGGMHCKITLSHSEFAETLHNYPTTIISIDQWVYGGLVESRVLGLTQDEANAKMHRLETILKQYQGTAGAFAVLLRQAPSAFNEQEEKIASTIKRASMQHKNKHLLRSILKQLPSKVWKTYLETRKRNFSVNEHVIEFVKKEHLKFLAIAMDDLASHGLNEEEFKLLQKRVRKDKLTSKINLLPGTDEMGMMLLAKLALEDSEVSPKIHAIYSASAPDQYKLRYEDRPLSKIVKTQIDLLGGRQVNTTSEADIMLFIHSPQEDQLDVPIVLTPSQSAHRVSKPWIDKLMHSMSKGTPCILADVRYANGADAPLMQTLRTKIPLSDLYGYSAWNTTANTLGIALSQGVVRWAVKKTETVNDDSEKAQHFFLQQRMLEDWLYQAEIRPKLLARLRSEGKSTMRFGKLADKSLTKEVKHDLMALYHKFLSKHFGSIDGLHVSFPWHRLFDIAIDF